MEQMTNSSRSN